MSARIVVTGVLLVFLLLITVFLVETMIPLSIFSDFNEYCKIALIQMEAVGGMTPEIYDRLTEDLESLNLVDIYIEGTEDVKYGEFIRLYVTAAIKGQRMVSLLERALQYQYISYDKTSVSRRIIK